VSSGVTPEATIAKALTPIAIENLRPRPKRYEIPDGGCRGLRVVVQPTPATGVGLIATATWNVTASISHDKITFSDGNGRGYCGR